MNHKLVLNFSKWKWSLLNVQLTRTLYCKTWTKEYNYDLAKNIENYWSPILEQSQTNYSQDKTLAKTSRKKYILSMFPYPSGRLHLGHVRVYALSDLLARYNRMRGYYVIHPIGWDSFGLPAENAAIERNIPPDIWTESNVEYMKKQLKELGLSFDWNRELSTCKENYYKWTQYLFLELFKKGVVVQKEALVNWDPVDKTVLANEQIDENGRSWRSGSIVEKKILKQWFIKSSAYAKSLLDSLDSLSTDDWNIVKSIQKMWIGNCNGCFVDFQVKHAKESSTASQTISVFTQHPQAIYGISHLNISKHHILLKNLEGVKEGEKLSCVAINPFNGERIPIYLRSDAEFGTLNASGVPYVDSKLAIPSLNENDRIFAQKNSLPYRNILDEQNKQKLVNSKELTNLTLEEAFDKACKLLVSMKIGGHLTSDRLNDWCISRQRYWGTPIPLVYCDNCQVVPVPYEQLPVRLPEIKNLSEKSNLRTLTSWVNTKCPKCGNEHARRETDTMDTFIDSSWYYLRYLDVNNNHEPFSSQIAHEQMPVDIYIGGIEHAMTHLFVSRLISHFLYDQGKLPEKEPFKRFISMGMVKGETFKTSAGKYIPSADVEVSADGKFVHKLTKEALNKDFEKMSKSKMNGIDPQFMIQKFGVDFTRFFLLSFVHPKSDRNFSLSDDMLNGALATFQRMWELVGSVCESAKIGQFNKNDKDYKKISAELYSTRNSQLAMIGYNLNGNFNVPSYLVASTKLFKFLKKYPSKYYDEAFFKLLVESLIIISPVMPHFANECWSKLKQNIPDIRNFDKEKLINELKWPEIDHDWMADLTIKKHGKNVIKTKISIDQVNNLTKKDAIEMLKDKKLFDGEENRVSLSIRPFLSATITVKSPKTNTTAQEQEPEN